MCSCGRPVSVCNNPVPTTAFRKASVASKERFFNVGHSGPVEYYAVLLGASETDEEVTMGLRNILN